MGHRIDTWARQTKHADGITWFLSKLEAEAKADPDSELMWSVPTARSDRAYNWGESAIAPDAVGEMTADGLQIPFYLEYELRARHPKRLELPGRVAVPEDHRAPSHISKTVLSTVHFGPPDRTIIDGRWYPRRLAVHRFPIHRELQLTLPKRVSQRTLSTRLPAARRIVETWRNDCNAVRPHCASGNGAPREFPHQGGRNRPVGF